MNFSERMAAKLKEARRIAHVTAGDAGSAVSRSDKTIYAWENGQSEPSAEQLITLCKLYGVDITFFYADDNLADSESELSRVDELELIGLYRDMSEKNQSLLIEIARAFCGKVS